MAHHKRRRPKNRRARRGRRSGAGDRARRLRGGGVRPILHLSHHAVVAESKRARKKKRRLRDSLKHPVVPYDAFPIVISDEAFQAIKQGKKPPS